MRCPARAPCVTPGRGRKRSVLRNTLGMAVFGLTLLAFCGAGEAGDRTKGGGPVVLMSTSKGDIKIELYRDKAPVTVENFLAYVNDKFFDGTIFHRVVPDFVIQGGGFTADMKQKRPRSPIKNEADNGLNNDADTVAMARTSAVDSATSQFFINLKDNGFLNHSSRDFGYAVFGRVVEGMDVVKEIGKVGTGQGGPYQDVPVDAVMIRSVRVIEGGEKKPAGE